MTNLRFTVLGLVVTTDAIALRFASAIPLKRLGNKFVLTMFLPPNHNNLECLTKIGHRSYFKKLLELEYKKGQLTLMLDSSPGDGGIFHLFVKICIFSSYGLWCTSNVGGICMIPLTPVISTPSSLPISHGEKPYTDAPHCV